MTTHTYLSLDQARDLARTMIQRYMDAQELLAPERDAQSREYDEACSRFACFLDGAVYAFKGRTQAQIQGDIFHALVHEGETRPKHGDGRVEWMGRMIDHLTNRWGVTDVTLPRRSADSSN